MNSGRGRIDPAGGQKQQCGQEPQGDYGSPEPEEDGSKGQSSAEGFGAFQEAGGHSLRIIGGVRLPGSYNLKLSPRQAVILKRRDLVQSKKARSL